MLIFIKLFDCSGSEEERKYPEIKTNESACVDIDSCLHTDLVTVYSAFNEKLEIPVERDDQGRKYIDLDAGDRAMVPTGWRMLIPHGFQLKILPRSGLSLKRGLTLVNTPGTIDSDYTDEVMILLHNVSETRVSVYDGESICQAELAPTMMKSVNFKPCGEKEILRHKETSNRRGGFGHTDQIKTGVETNEKEYESLQN